MMLEWLVLPPTVAMIVLFIALIGFLMIFVVKTPAMTFFKAFMTGKMVTMFFRGDRRIQFQTADLDTSCIDHKKYGTFHVDRETVYNEVKSGSAIVSISTDFGASLAPEMALALSKLNSMGIKSAAQAEEVDKRYYHCSECKEDRVIDLKESSMVDAENNTIIKITPTCPDHPNAGLTKVSLQVDISEDKRTIAWHQIKQYLSSQANPVMLRALKERQLDSERQDLRSVLGGNAKFVGIGMAVFLALLGVVIFYMFMNNQNSNDLVGQCRILWDIIQ